MATMPAAPRPRQASVADWYATDAGCSLGQSQHSTLRQLLAQRPHQPLLWLAPAPGWGMGEPCLPRTLLLHRQADGWAGELVARLPLPLASASFGTVVLQHPAPDAAAALVADCARLLLPGGVLLLVGCRGMHPQRMLHPTLPLWRQPRPGWRRLLALNGLLLRGSHALPPPHPGLAAACVVLEAEKRTQALVGPRPVPRLAVQPTGRHSLKVT